MVKLLTSLFIAFALLAAIPTAPSAISGKDQNGKMHDLNDLKGAFTVIDFAATWCNPCWKALPHVEALAQEFPDLKLLVISEDSKPAARDSMVKKLKLTVPVIWDENHVWANHFKPKGMPTTLVLNKKGQVIYRHEGFSQKKWGEFRQALKGFLKNTD